MGPTGWCPGTYVTADTVASRQTYGQACKVLKRESKVFKRHPSNFDLSMPTLWHKCNLSLSQRIKQEYSFEYGNIRLI